jgi:hypothetical protein
MRSLRIVQIVLLACLVAGMLAAGAADIFGVNGRYVFPTQPVVLSALILGLLFVAVRALSQPRASFVASLLATLSWAAAVGVVLTRLTLAAATPSQMRTIDTWHLWPLFTLLWLLVASGPLLTAAVLIAWFTRRRQAADHNATASKTSLATYLIVALVLSGALAVALGPRVQEWIAVDACLDAGGRFDYAVKVCRSLHGAPGVAGARQHTGVGEADADGELDYHTGAR